MSDLSRHPRALFSFVRRPRFSLRTSLIAMTLLSVCFAFYFNRVQCERRAAHAVVELSGDIVYDWQIRLPDSDPKMELKPPGPNWLRQRLGPHWFDRIVEVRLHRYGTPTQFKRVGPHLAKLPALRSLFVSGKLSQEDCDSLGSLKQIEELILMPETILESSHTASIAQARGLTKLIVNDAKFSGSSIRNLAALPKLREIDISCHSHDMQTGMPLTEHLLTDETAHALASFSHLRSIMLFNTVITNEGVESLCRLPQLETLVVSSPHVTSATFEHIAKLHQLRHLGTWQWKIFTPDLQKLSQLPNLVSLGLITKLSDEIIASLPSLGGLERLSLTGDEITVACVPQLCKMQKLAWLDLGGTSIPKQSAAAAELKRALPNCRIILPKTEAEKEMERQFHDWKYRQRQATSSQPVSTGQP